MVGDERYPFDHLVVCVGTEPSGLPGFDMDHPAILTSNDILLLESVPETMIVVGGGVVGCEFASLFAPLGTQITVVEILPRLLAGIDDRTASQFQRLLEKDGVTVHLGRQVAEVSEYRDDGVTVKLDDGTEISAEKLLVSVGRRSQAAGIGLEALGVEVTERGHRGGRRVPAHRQPDDLGGGRLHRRASSSRTWPRPRPAAPWRTRSRATSSPWTGPWCRAASTPTPRSRRSA